MSFVFVAPTDGSVQRFFVDPENPGGSLFSFTEIFRDGIRLTGRVFPASGMVEIDPAEGRVLRERALSERESALVRFDRDSARAADEAATGHVAARRDAVDRLAALLVKDKPVKKDVVAVLSELFGV